MASIIETKQILIAEDEDIVAINLQEKLNSMGYVVPYVVSSGEEAIQKAIEVHPDLVIMDIRLEGDKDGVEAAKEIRSRLSVPLIYLTGYADYRTVQRAKITEPFGYIMKPFDEVELFANIELALYKSKMERKLKENEELLSAILEGTADADDTNRKKYNRLRALFYLNKYQDNMDYC